MFNCLKKHKQWMSAVMALIFLFSTITPAWAREGNYGSESWEAFAGGALAGAVTDIFILIGGGEGGTYAAAAGSIASNLVGNYMYFNCYSEYGEKSFSFQVFGTEVVITKGQVASMIAGVVAGVAAGAVSGALSGAGKGATDGATDGAVNGVAGGAGEATAQAVVATILDQAAQNLAKEAAEQTARKIVEEVIKDLVESIVKGVVVGLAKLIISRTLEELMVDKWGLDRGIASVLAGAVTAVGGYMVAVMIAGKGETTKGQKMSDAEEGAVKAMDKASAEGMETEMNVPAELDVKVVSTEGKAGGVKVAPQNSGAGSGSGSFFQKVLSIFKGSSDKGKGGDNVKIDAKLLEGASPVEGNSHQIKLADGRIVEIKGEVKVRVDGSQKVKTIAVAELYAAKDNGNGSYTLKDGSVVKLTLGSLGELARVQNGGSEFKLPGGATVRVKGVEIQKVIESYTRLAGKVQNIIVTEGDLVRALDGRPLSDLGFFERMGEGARTLGLRPFVTAGVQAGALLLMDYQSYNGTDKKKKRNNAIKMAVARGAGGLAGDAFANWDSVNSFYAGTDENPWRTRQEGITYGQYLGKAFATEVGGTLAEAGFSQLTYKWDLNTQYGIQGLVHSLGGSLTSGVIDALARSEEGAATKEVYVRKDYYVDAKSNTEYGTEKEAQQKLEKEGWVMKEKSDKEGKIIFVNEKGEKKELTWKQYDENELSQFSSSENYHLVNVGSGQKTIVKTEKEVELTKLINAQTGEVRFSKEGGLYTEPELRKMGFYKIPSDSKDKDSFIKGQEITFISGISESYGNVDGGPLQKCGALDWDLKSAGRFVKSVGLNSWGHFLLASESVIPGLSLYNNPSTGPGAYQNYLNSQDQFIHRVDMLMQGVSPTQAIAMDAGSALSSQAAGDFANSFGYAFANYWLPEQYRSYAAFMPDKHEGSKTPDKMIINLEQEVEKAKMDESEEGKKKLAELDKQLKDLKIQITKDVQHLDRYNKEEGVLAFMPGGIIDYTVQRRVEGRKIDKDSKSRIRAFEEQKYDRIIETATDKAGALLDQGKEKEAREANEEAVSAADKKMETLTAIDEGQTTRVVGNYHSSILGRDLGFATYGNTPFGRESLEAGKRDLARDFFIGGEGWEIKAGKEEEFKHLNEKLEKCVEGRQSEQEKLTGLSEKLYKLEKSKKELETGKKDTQEIQSQISQVEQQIKMVNQNIKTTNTEINNLNFAELVDSEVKGLKVEGWWTVIDASGKTAIFKDEETAKEYAAQLGKETMVAGSLNQYYQTGDRVFATEVEAQNYADKENNEKFRQEIKDVYIERAKNPNVTAISWILGEGQDNLKGAKRLYNELSSGVVFYSNTQDLLERTVCDQFGRMKATYHYGMQYQSQEGGGQGSFVYGQLPKFTEHYYGAFGRAVSITKDYSEIDGRTIKAEDKRVSKKERTTECITEQRTERTITEKQVSLDNHTRMLGVKTREEEVLDPDKWIALPEEEVKKEAKADPRLKEKQGTVAKSSKKQWEEAGHKYKEKWTTDISATDWGQTAWVLLTKGKTKDGKTWDQLTSEEREAIELSQTTTAIRYGQSYFLAEQGVKQKPTIASGRRTIDDTGVRHPRDKTDPVNVEKVKLIYVPAVTTTKIVTTTEPKTEIITETVEEETGVSSKPIKQGVNTTYDVNFYVPGSGHSPYVTPTYNAIASDIRSGQRLTDNSIYSRSIVSNIKKAGKEIFDRALRAKVQSQLFGFKTEGVEDHAIPAVDKWKEDFEAEAETVADDFVAKVEEEKQNIERNATEKDKVEVVGYALEDKEIGQQMNDAFSNTDVYKKYENNPEAIEKIGQIFKIAVKQNALGFSGGIIEKEILSDKEYNELRDTATGVIEVYGKNNERQSILDNLTSAYKTLESTEFYKNNKDNVVRLETGTGVFLETLLRKELSSQGVALSDRELENLGGASSDLFLSSNTFRDNFNRAIESGRCYTAYERVYQNYNGTGVAEIYNSTELVKSLEGMSDSQFKNLMDSPLSRVQQFQFSAYENHNDRILRKPLWNLTTGYNLTSEQLNLDSFSPSIVLSSDKNIELNYNEQKLLVTAGQSIEEALKAQDMTIKQEDFTKFLEQNKDTLSKEFHYDGDVRFAKTRIYHYGSDVMEGVSNSIKDARKDKDVAAQYYWRSICPMQLGDNTVIYEIGDQFPKAYYSEQTDVMYGSLPDILKFYKSSTGTGGPGGTLVVEDDYLSGSSRNAGLAGSAFSSGQ